MFRCCTIRTLGRDQQAQAGSLAIQENPLNRARMLATFNPGVPGLAALASDKRWQPGRELTIAFRYGTPAMRDVVMQAAATWSKYANIKFRQVDGNGMIRCSFDPALGSWSYIGVDILAIPRDQPTMNIGWGPDLPTCLHELGHTLGLIHEHQNPAAPIPWDIPKVLRYYQGAPNYWSKAEVYQQVIDPYNGPLTNGGYDKNSIMEYPIDAAMLTDPSYAVGWNLALSAKDISFIGQVYPGTANIPHWA